MEKLRTIRLRMNPQGRRVKKIKKKRKGRVSPVKLQRAATRRAAAHKIKFLVQGFGASMMPFHYFTAAGKWTKNRTGAKRFVGLPAAKVGLRAASAMMPATMRGAQIVPA